MERNILGRAITALMQADNITESELARRTGIVQPLINQIVNGKNINPKLATIKPIANYFSVSISQLIGEDPLPTSLQMETLRNKQKTWFEVPLLTWEKDNFHPQVKLDTSIAFTLTDLCISDSAFAVEMHGSSMEPLIPSKMTIIIEPNRNPVDRDLVFAYLAKPNLLLCRQILIDADDKYLQTINPNFVDATLHKLNAKDKILGVVVQAKKNF